MICLSSSSSLGPFSSPSSFSSDADDSSSSSGDSFFSSGSSIVDLLILWLVHFDGDTYDEDTSSLLLVHSFLLVPSDEESHHAQGAGAHSGFGYSGASNLSIYSSSLSLSAPSISISSDSEPDSSATFSSFLSSFQPHSFHTQSLSSSSSSDSLSESETSKV